MQFRRKKSAPGISGATRSMPALIELKPEVLNRYNPQVLFGKSGPPTP